MQDPDKKQGYLQTAETKPSLLLAGKNPRLIDEWQEAPALWDAVRVSIDSRNETGLYILTGSNSVDKSKISHSGTGRMAGLFCKKIRTSPAANSPRLHRQRMRN